MASRYDELCLKVREIGLLASIEELLGWDERTQMPEANAEHRADQMTLLAGMLHQRWTSSELASLIEELAQTDLAADPMSETGATIRRIARQQEKQSKLPKALVEELTRTAVLGQQAWVDARRKSDFSLFRPWLEKTLELKRQQAEALGYRQCPYDALLDDYEPDETTANIARILGELRDRLVPMVQEIQEASRKPDVSILHRKFPIDAQEAFGREAAALIGFDFDRGRLDVTTHPFCCSSGTNDCRITTRYNERFFNEAFFGILHEAGHGIYEQGLRADQFGLPLGEAASLGVHESQSRMWENLVGRGRPFWQHMYPKARRHFPKALADVPQDEFFFAVNCVQPSLIRVEADEVTYNLHILIRFELEQALLEGDLPVDELPSAWNAKYTEYLGVTPENDALGCLQDTHWSFGAFGYFPTYSLGNLYAAQLFEAADEELGGLAEPFARGDFAILKSWLIENVHRQGQRYPAAQLVERITGAPLTSEPLIRNLRDRLGPLYGIG